MKTRKKKKRESDATRIENATNALLAILRDVRGRRGRDFVRKLRFGETLDELDAKANARVELHFPGDPPLEMKLILDEPNRRLIWSEDDATCHMQYHEGLEAAYLRIFGEKLDYQAAVNKEDGGDGTEYRMPNGAIVWASLPGGSLIGANAEYDNSVAYGIAWCLEQVRQAPVCGRSLLRKIHEKGWKRIDVKKDEVKGRIRAALPFVVREPAALGKTGDKIVSYSSVYMMVAAGWELA